MVFFTLTGKHFELTESIREYVNEKVGRLPRYYSSIQRLDVILEGQKGADTKVKVEIIAKAKRRRIFVAKETGVDVVGCLESAVQKLEQRLRKIKTKERERKHTPKRS